MLLQAFAFKVLGTPTTIDFNFLTNIRMCLGNSDSTTPGLTALWAIPRKCDAGLRVSLLIFTWHFNITLFALN